MTAPSNFNSIGRLAFIKTSPGTLIRVRGWTAAPPDSCIHVFDANTDVPDYVDPITIIPINNGFFDLNYGGSGRAFAVGILAGLSSRAHPYLRDTSSIYVLYDAQYI